MKTVLYIIAAFVVDGEVFWGDDRLEDAVDWAKANWTFMSM